jgi:predicted membrane protein
MSNDCGTKHQKIRIEQHTFMGTAWCAAWLFTIGYLHLSFWRGIFAIIIWPYYIGVHAGGLLH